MAWSTTSRRASSLLPSIGSAAVSRKRSCVLAFGTGTGKPERSDSSDDAPWTAFMSSDSVRVPMALAVTLGVLPWPFP